MADTKARGAKSKATDEAPIDETIEERAERVSTEAKQTFSLRERFAGIKKRTAKVVLFLDLEAMDATAEARREADAIFAQAEMKGLTPERRAALLDEHEKALQRLDASKEALSETLSVVHLKTIDSIETNAAVRKARKRITAMREVMSKRAADESRSDEQREEAREWLEDEQEHFQNEISVFSLVKGIDRIAHGDGTVDVGLSADDVRAMQALPANQWREVTTTFENLLFDEQIARAAVDEPGFSQGS